MPHRPPRTRAARLAQERLERYLRVAREESISDWDVRHKAPDAWRTLELDLDVVEKKRHVTLRLDESVAAFYRAMGPGYQARINRVLAMYAQMKILQLLAIDEAILARRLARVEVVEDEARSAEGGGMSSGHSEG